MKITSITTQVKNPNRVSVSVDGKYRFSLDVYQLVDLGLKIGKEYSEDELVHLEQEGQFGKLYARALEYCLMRPHSAREVRDYLRRKTLTTRYKAKDGQMKKRQGVSQTNVERTFNRLVEKGYINDEKFAQFWVENRNQAKGISKRKLTAELYSKGVDRSIVDQVLAETLRDDQTELKKIIAKKRAKYDDQKLIAYLARQGFGFDDIKAALADNDAN